MLCCSGERYRAIMALLFLLLFFSEIRLDILCESSALADDSHEMSRLIFFEKLKKIKK